MPTQLLNMDCMEFMKDCADNSFDLCIADPPYGIARFKNCKENKNPDTKDVFANKFLGNEKFNNEKPTQEYFKELFRVSKNQIIWGANNFILPPSEYFCCWNKEQAMPNFATLEYAWVSMGLKKPAKLFTYSIHRHNQTDKIHPTQKPVPLYMWLLKTYAETGQRILDTHLGSGLSAIAAHYFGCDFTGSEIDEDYFNAAQKRFARETRQISMF